MKQSACFKKEKTMEIKQIFNSKYSECAVSVPCNYKLPNSPGSAVFSVDCVFRQDRNSGGNRCDEFIFLAMHHNSTGIYLVERKDNKSHDVEKVQSQLQGGANFIERFLDSDPATYGCGLDFLPVWVSKGIGQRLSWRLRKIKISLRGKKKFIVHSTNKKTLPKIV